MSINQQIAQQILSEMVKTIDLVFDRDWSNHRFSKFKLASTTEKGNLGEDFLVRALKCCGYTDIQMPQGRRGAFDLAVVSGTKKMLIEVKVATKDVHNSFQFNGLRRDKEYTHAFCLGISPDEIGYLMMTKEWLLKNETLVSMAQDAPKTLKLTKSANHLKSFDEFCQEIDGFFADA